MPQILFFLPTILIILFLFVLVFVGRKSKFFPFVKKYFIAVILILFFFNGLIYVFSMPYWSPIDEGSHFAFVQFLDENKRLPLLSDYSTPEVLAIGEGKYPNPPKYDPEHAGLAGELYEFFQPPLYYISSLPAYWLGGSNFINKIFALRIWGLIQLLALVLITFKIFENLKPFFQKNYYFYALGGIIIVGLTPAMIVRATTVGNAVLPIIFVSLVLWWMSKFVKDNREVSKKDAAVMGIFTSLAILSRFTVLFLMPLVFLFLLIKRKRFFINLMVYAVTFSILISPWLAFNKLHYGTFTTNEQAKQQQMGVVNPKSITYDWEFVRSEISPMFIEIWAPQEMNWKVFKNWDPKFLEISEYSNYIWVVGVILAFLLSIFFLLKRKDYIYFFINFIIIAAIIGCLAQQIGATIVGNWPVMEGRYLHPIIIPIALMFAYGIYQLRFHFFLRLVAAAIILIPIILNLEYVYMLINS